MTTALLNLGRRFLGLSWLTGPIFEKELRVSSRRRRNYVLRFAYLGLLTCFLAVFWIRTVPRSSSNLNQISRMAEAGKGIIAFIIWFQFIATQIVALMMLSTSVSDEIYNRTLGLLMTTPINSFQIVIGKLFSKLLQIVLLMGISLPLLAIVRVFGGVPWMYVISSLCMTLTAVVFVGSLSLLFSVFSRRAYAVIIVTALTLGVLFLLLPYLSGFLYNAIIGQWPGPRLTGVIFYPNPYGMMMFNTIMMLEPRATGGIPAMFWPGHCGIMLGASVVVLFACVCVVRRVALRQAVGQTGASSSGKRRKSAASAGSEHLALPRRVTGPAVLWKELRTPMLGRRKIAMVAAIFAGLIVLFITYALCASENALDDGDTHVVYVIIFAGLGMLFTIILPATCITTEKESQAWPLLLATTLSDWQILIGKFAGFLRRCLPIWFLLFGHIIIFTLSGVIHPVAIIQMGILVAWIVVFLFGTGVYFSARVRHTTTAVIANFALAGAIWALAPILLGLIASVGRTGDDLFEAYIAANPMVHAGVVMDGTTGTLGSYYWPSFNSLNAAQSTVWMLACMLGYMLLGVLFAWRAKCRFRRNIF